MFWEPNEVPKGRLLLTVDSTEGGMRRELRKNKAKGINARPDVKKAPVFPTVLPNQRIPTGLLLCF
jgi:hypothetical protein